MVDWSIGSVANHCYNSFDNVSSNVSGVLYDLALLSLQRVENWTGDDVNETIIPVAYRPAITAFTMCELANRMQIQGGGVKTASVEGLSATKDFGALADSWDKIGMEHLRRLGKGGGYYKVLE